MVSPQKTVRVVPTHTQCTRKGLHLVSFCHPFFLIFLIQRSPTCFKNEGRFVSEILQQGISVWTKGISEPFFEKKITHVLVVPKGISFLEHQLYLTYCARIYAINFYRQALRLFCNIIIFLIPDTSLRFIYELSLTQEANTRDEQSEVFSISL